MKTNTLTPELLHQRDAYWRATNYLSGGQICLCDNPLLKLADPATHPEHLKRLEEWLRSYRAEELFENRVRLKPELAKAALPAG